MTAQHTCSGQIWTGYRYRECSYKAAHEHEGAMYCKMHHPPTVKAKLEKKTAAYIEEADRRAAVYKAEATENAEMKRRAECFLDLLEALQSAHQWMDDQADAQSKSGHATFDLMMLREQRDKARAAIARATHKEQA